MGRFGQEELWKGSRPSILRLLTYAQVQQSADRPLAKLVDAKSNSDCSTLPIQFTLSWMLVIIMVVVFSKQCVTPTRTCSREVPLARPSPLLLIVAIPVVVPRS